MEDRTGWIRIGRLLSWVVAGSFLLATVMFLLVEFGITTPEASPAPPDLVDATLASFRDEQAGWPQELTSSLLFALGFAALAALGVLLARALAADLVRGSITSFTFVAAGTLGVAAQLLYVGVKQVAIDPHYCDCRYAPEQIISQARGLALAEGAQRWLLGGFLVLAGLGFYQLAQSSLRRRLFNPRWAGLSHLMAAVFVLGLVGLAPQWDLAFRLVVLVGGGILLPIWSIWLHRELPTLATPEAVQATPTPPEPRPT